MAREFYIFSPGFDEPTAVYRIDDRTRVSVFDLDSEKYVPAGEEISHDVRFAIYGNGELTYERAPPEKAARTNRSLVAKHRAIADALE